MIFTRSITKNFRNNSAFALIFFLAGTLYLPVILLWTGIIPFAYRFAVLLCAVVVMASYVMLRRFRLSDLGFRRDTLKPSLMWNLGISVLFILLLVLLSCTGLVGRSPLHFWPVFFVAYALILSPLQEFFFRSILFAEMRSMRCNCHGSVIVLSALSFCFLHVIYPSPMMMAVALFMGVVWGLIYYRYPNFWGVALSHALLGVTAFSVGLI